MSSGAPNYPTSENLPNIAPANLTTVLSDAMSNRYYSKVESVPGNFGRAPASSPHKRKRGNEEGGSCKVRVKLTAHEVVVEWECTAQRMKKDLQEVRVDGFGGGMEWNLEESGPTREKIRRNGT